MVQFFIGGGALRQDPSPQDPRQADRPRRLRPPEKIAFHMRTPAMVPQARPPEIGPRLASRSSPGCSPTMRCSSPAPRRPGRHRVLADTSIDPGRLEAACAEAIAPGATRPTAPSKGSSRPRPPSGTSCPQPPPGRRRRGVPSARPGLVRERHPHAPCERDPQGDAVTPGDLACEGSTVMTIRHRHGLPTAARRVRAARPRSCPGHARHPRCPPGPNPRRELGHLEFLQVLCEDEISRRRSCMSLAAQDPLSGQGSRPRPPWRGSTSRASPKLPAAQDLAIWPPCAGCTPASR